MGLGRPGSRTIFNLNSFAALIYPAERLSFNSPGDLKFLLGSGRPDSHRQRHASSALRRSPRAPGAEELRNQGRKFPPNHLHATWLDYLYWDAELEA